MSKYLPYLLVMITTFTIVLMAGYMHPQWFRTTWLKVDKMGLMEISRAENARQAAIFALPIRYEQKQALIDHKVFMGASSQMVMLSLGKPKAESTRSDPTTQQSITLWHIYLPDDVRPTVFEFQQDKLVNAYKGSALDMQ